MTYYYSVVRYEPSRTSYERINIGVIIGNDAEGFKATWNVARAVRAFEDDTIEAQAFEIIKDLMPMTTEKLVAQCDTLRPGVMFGFPHWSNIETLDAALEAVCKLYLV